MGCNMFFLSFYFALYCNNTPRMVATPTGKPIPIAILSDVLKPPEDAVPVSLAVAVTVDKRLVDVCELVVGLAPVILAT